MAQLQPQQNGTFRILGFSEKIAAIDGFSGEIAGVCQMRLDFVGEVVELLGDSEVELDMSHGETASVVRIMAMSAMDHFQICDFEMAISICEILLELDPEDHNGSMVPLAYSYAMTSDNEAVEQLLPFLDMYDGEKELIRAIARFQGGSADVAVPPQIRKELMDAESDLSLRTAHLWLEIPKLKQLLYHD